MKPLKNFLPTNKFPTNTSKLRKAIEKRCIALAWIHLASTIVMLILTIIALQTTLAHLALFVNIGAKVFIFQKLTSSSKIGKKLQVSQRASERELNTFYLLLLLLLLH